jgi:hypothetical protein
MRRASPGVARYEAIRVRSQIVVLALFASLEISRVPLARSYLVGST